VALGAVSVEELRLQVLAEAQRSGESISELCRRWGGGEGRWRPSRDGRAATARAQASGSRMRKGREPGADMEVGGVLLSRRSTRVGAGRATQG